MVLTFETPNPRSVTHVQPGSHLVTDLASRLSVCHFLHTKLVSFLLNHRGTIFHENMLLLVHEPCQRLVEEHFSVLSISMYSAEFMPLHTHHKLALSIVPNQISPQTNKGKPPCLAAIHSPKILHQLISTPTHGHCTRIGRVRTPERRSQLAKSPVKETQCFLDHLLGPPASPIGYVGWWEMWLASRCSTFIAKCSKVPSDSWHTQLHLL